MTVFADIPPGLMRKFVIRTTLWIIFLGVVLFGTAGTIHWPQGWIYLGFLTVVSFVSGPWLAKHDPELFRERLGSLFQKEELGQALGNRDDGGLARRARADGA